MRRETPEEKEEFAVVSAACSVVFAACSDVRRLALARSSEEKKEFAVVLVAPSCAASAAPSVLSALAFADASRSESGLLLVTAKCARPWRGRCFRIGSKKSFEPSKFCGTGGKSVWYRD